MTTANAPEQEAAVTWDGSLNLSVPMFGRRVGLMVQWREAHVIRRALLSVTLMSLAGKPIDFLSYRVLTHSAGDAASLTAANAVALMVIGIPLGVLI